MQRKTLSLLMLTAYLVAVILQMAVVLACPCLVRHYEVEVTTPCCAHCTEHLCGETPLHVDEGCCCLHDHSTRLELYTHSLENQEWQLLRVAVVALLFAPLSEPQLNALFLERGVYCPESVPLPSEELYLGGAPFRAPPAFA